MNRENKFRVWFQEKWNYFTIGQSMTDFQYAIYTQCCLLGLKFYQFLGIKDKNGVDIYEGATCRINFYDEGLKNGKVVFRVLHSGYYLEGDFGQYSMGTWEPSYIEVVGNIYENPLSEG